MAQVVVGGTHFLTLPLGTHPIHVLVESWVYTSDKDLQVSGPRCGARLLDPYTTPAGGAWSEFTHACGWWHAEAVLEKQCFSQLTNC